jgi:uncharacterized cupredoxin-like copper-binding protein
LGYSTDTGESSHPSPIIHHPNTVDYPVGICVPAGDDSARVLRKATRRLRQAALVHGEAELNRERVRRTGAMAAIASMALVVLVACGGEGPVVEEDVTRVPTMSDAAAQATREAPSEATPGAEASPAAASPVAEASPAATPVSGEAIATPAEEAAGTAAPQEATAEASPAATAEEPAAAEEAAEPVEIISHDIFFDPNEFSIPADIDVAVSLPNEGVTLHNFSIDALGIDVDIDPGATEETVINAPAGTYEFYCNVPGHKAAGMFGTLTVE